MKKETHCVYRYRIWHGKHESTLGLGGLQAGLLDTGPLPTALWPMFSPRSQTSEVGRLIASSFFPDTTLSHFVAQSWRRIHCEKELGLSSCHEEGNCISFQAAEISPSETTVSGRLAVMVPRYARTEQG